MPNHDNQNPFQQPVVVRVPIPVAIPIVIPIPFPTREPIVVPVPLPMEPPTPFLVPTYGFLQIKTSTQPEATPFAGAIVTVYDNSEEIYSVLTKKNGETPILSLVSPDSPIILGTEHIQIPFTSYRVEIHKDGFFGVEIPSVQIFAGEFAYIPVTMFPNPDDN